MATKKDKIIEEAQRMALRGQLDKAIKLYEQVMQLDPSAINHRQKLAELLAKAGYNEDARVELETIGKHYSSNGFYLKAIAVHKKIQTLFPHDITISLTVADLNEKHGLVANALAEYSRVYDYYEKASNTTDALKILEKMLSIDKQNAGIRLRLAETYFQYGKKEESYTEFSRLAALLQEKGADADVEKIHARIQQLFSEKTDFILEIFALQLAEGRSAGAISGLRSVLHSDPHNQRAWDLLIEAYQKSGRTEQLKAAYQQYLVLFPTELSARTGLLDCLITEQDLPGALELVVQYEQELFDGVPGTDLAVIFGRLEQLDPVNVTILKQLQRSYELIDDHEKAAAVSARISSLGAFSADQPARFESELLDTDSGFYDDLAEASILPDDFLEPIDSEGTAPLSESAVPHADSLEVEIEIEFEIDDDSGFYSDESEGVKLSTDNWFDSGAVVLDGIPPSARSVRFGSDLEGSDAQSHYDLGIAFKEMGLYDEAVNEFLQAAADPLKRVASLVLHAACLREKGDLSTAENALKELLLPGLPLEDDCMIRYELSAACEAAGKHDEANALLAGIHAVNPDFSMSHRETTDDDMSLEFSDDDLDGFDLK